MDVFTAHLTLQISKKLLAKRMILINGFRSQEFKSSGTLSTKTFTKFQVAPLIC